MRTVKPINPIRPVRGISAIRLRRVPSFKQLRMWLVFARQKAKDGPKRQPASGQADAAPPEAPADWQSEVEKGVPGQGHIDKLA